MACIGDLDIGQRLIENRDHIVALWEKRVRLQNMVANDVSGPFLRRDTVGAVLDKIADSLAGEQRRGQSSPTLQATSAVRPEQVVSEYAILGITIVGVLELDRSPLTRHERESIHSAISGVIKDAGAAFLQNELDGTKAVRLLIQTALEKLQHEQHLREEFISTLAHDLRNPLAIAQMNAQLLMRADKPELRQELSRKIVAAIERADNLICDLLDVNRVRAGNRLAITISHFDLGQLLRRTAEELSTLYGDRIRVVAVEPIEGWWGESELRRTVTNLVNNAVHYGAVDSPIVVSAVARGDDDVLLSVHNVGNPIPPEQQAHLFEPYQRLANSAAAQKGWGLGLAIAHAIVESHGGELCLESTPEKGTTFTMRLPRDTRKLVSQ
jgi:signal transduction histidine kinase